MGAWDLQGREVHAIAGFPKFHIPLNTDFSSKLLAAKCKERIWSEGFLIFNCKFLFLPED